MQGCEDRYRYDRERKKSVRSDGRLGLGLIGFVFGGETAVEEIEDRIDAVFGLQRLELAVGFCGLASHSVAGFFLPLVQELLAIHLQRAGELERREGEGRHRYSKRRWKEGPSNPHPTLRRSGLETRTPFCYEEEEERKLLLVDCVGERAFHVGRLHFGEFQHTQQALG